MTPGAPTGPGESAENLDKRADETTYHGEQVRWMSDTCEKLRREDREFQSLIERYDQGTVSKDELRVAFKKKLGALPANIRKKIGITDAADPTDTEIENFLGTSKAFESQLMFQIETDTHAKKKARENMIRDCIAVAQDDYENFDPQELKTSLEKEGKGRLRTFLEVPRYREAIIKKLPGSQTLKNKTLGNIDFDAISQSIRTLDPTHPKRREIQEAWIKISGIAQPGETLADAFARIGKEGGAPSELAGAYETFFSPQNTLISPENRERILNFLVQHYVPLVPARVLESIDKSVHTLSAEEEAILLRDMPHDAETAQALSKEKERIWKKIHVQEQGEGTAYISTRSLPFATKVRILGQFGSIGKAEKMEEYYKGRPGSLRVGIRGEDEYRKRFITTHDFDPEKVETHEGLVTELKGKLGHKIEGIENFLDGCAMRWTTKDKDNNEVIGYYIIDRILPEEDGHEGIMTVRFLGNNREPLSPTGMVMHYTGSDFYHYLAGCGDTGKISFIPGDTFEKEMEENEQKNKLPRYYTQLETHAEMRKQAGETVEVMNLDTLNYELDQLLNPRGENEKESKDAEERKIHEGMILAVRNGSMVDTVQIESIDEAGGKVTLWDGHGSGPKSRQEYSFTDFIALIKYNKSGGDGREIYRIPTGKKPFGVSEFNLLFSNEKQNPEGKHKKFRRIQIQEKNGKLTFGESDPDSGNFSAKRIIKVGNKNDLLIESIDGNQVTVRRGTFTQMKEDKEKGKVLAASSFKGTASYTIPLSSLWAHIHTHASSFEFDDPKEGPQHYPGKEQKNPSMSWWNILKHTHSLGVILHGDLWKAPFKAWEEQHHKDHAFAGKLTAALAVEKIQSGSYGPVSGIFNWAEWPSLMVADGNSSFQSYLDELVNKIDAMGSYHRTRLIKKWATKEHFPSPKFMAAMFASMKIFGQLYPYDFDESNYQTEGDKKKGKKSQWFWYNSICHSIDPDGHKWPHMPPHGDEKWPKILLDEGGNPMGEVQACHLVFDKFNHPLLKIHKRLLQTFAMSGQKELQDGAQGNLSERPSMESKLEWMMSTALSSKLPELFGAGTELWLKEGYPTQISTMPYAAMLFGCRDQQLLPATTEHIKKQFQDEGIHMPMFVFMQNKNLGDVFRTTGIALAHTISPECGNTLERLVNKASNERLWGGSLKSWRKEFEKFWTDHGNNLMSKLCGMKDPMIQMMIYDPQTFDEMLVDQPPEKREQYKKLRENKGAIQTYYERLKNTYDSPSHVNMDRGKGYYSGDHFRFRKFFESGNGGISWINLDAYMDANLDPSYASGSNATAGDGVFNELRAFMYAIPDMAEKIAKDMGYEHDPQKKKYTDKISETLYKKTTGDLKRLAEQKIKATNPEAIYCSATAMMFEFVEVKLMSVGGSDTEQQAQYRQYYDQMRACLERAKEIERNEGFAAGIRYREKMANKWTKIVQAKVDTRKVSIDDIANVPDPVDLGKEDIKAVGKKTRNNVQDKLRDFETLARTGNGEN